MIYSNTRGRKMLPVPKDENFQIDSSGWSFEPPAGEYNEAESEEEILNSDPEAFDYGDDEET